VIFEMERLQLVPFGHPLGDVTSRHRVHDLTAGLPGPGTTAGPGHAGGQPGVGEPDPGRDGNQLQGAVLSSAVALGVLVMNVRHLRPGHVTQLGVQGGLVAFDDEDVPAAVLVQVSGVGPLGVQGVFEDVRVMPRCCPGSRLAAVTTTSVS